MRAAIPDAAITTDIIVGFPGETEEDFQATLDVVRAARFSSAYTFQYSKRPGTPAATLDDQIAPDVVKDRYLRLAAVVDEVAWTEAKTLVGRTPGADGVGGGGPQGCRHAPGCPAEAPDNRLVHFAADFTWVVSADSVRPGDMVTVEITYAAPHHLVADGAIRSVRRTRAGDAWERRTSAPAAPTGVGLGMPTVGVPAAAAAGACLRLSARLRCGCDPRLPGDRSVIRGSSGAATGTRLHALRLSTGRRRQQRAPTAATVGAAWACEHLSPAQPDACRGRPTAASRSRSRSASRPSTAVVPHADRRARRSAPRSAYTTSR